MAQLSDLFIDPDNLGTGGLGRLHLIFLLVVYGFILSKSSQMIADGSELLLLIPSLAGIVGSIVLPVLGAVPDGAIVLFSGLGPVDEVKEQIAVGVGALAGSTIMLLTIPWALCIWQGRCDIENGDVNYKGKPKLSVANKWSLTKAGIAPRTSVVKNGRIMLITMISYIVIQAAGFGADCAKDENCHPKTEHWAALVALLLSIFCFAGYMVYNVKYADQEDKDDIVLEVKKRAIESHIISLSTAFEGVFSPNEESKERQSVDMEKRLDEALKTFFNRYDKNGDQVIDAFELRTLLTDVGEEMSEAKFQQLYKEIDSDGSGEINFKEFSVAMKDFISRKNAHLQSVSSDDVGITLTSMDEESSNGASEGDKNKIEVKTHQKESKEDDADDEEDEEEEEEVPEDIAKLPKDKQRLRILLRSGWMMGVGTVIVLLFSDPMVDVLNALGNSFNIAPFYVAFVLAPVASNASELIASIAYAKKKTKKSITISLAALEGAACMNNTFCLFIFLCLIFGKGLAWEFSAETISIVVVELCIFVFTTMKINRVWHAIIILSLYPLSIILVWLLENKAGLN